MANLIQTRLIKENVLLEFARYFGKSKILQYFGNVRYSSVIPDTFAEVVKDTNYTWLWNVKLDSYSSRATRRICFYVLNHGCEIIGF